MQSIFKRFEDKYHLTREQGASIQEAIAQHMKPDEYGEYLVQNLYYDTDNWDVIRASLEKPVYKEKLRLRCYGVPDQDTNLFLELKKKYRGIVYKRRIAVPMTAFSQGTGTIRDIVSGKSSQISRELDFYMKNNAVYEKIYISYMRSAFAGIEEDKGLRITLDTDVCYRLDRLNYSTPGDGCYKVLPQDKTLMEIKTLGGMPLWLSHVLCENKIYPTSFSKYGACYIDHISRMLIKPETEPEKIELEPPERSNAERLVLRNA